MEHRMIRGCLNPTNALRVARAVRPDANGVEQLLYYDSGAGSYHAKLQRGVSGLGIAKDIRHCFLQN